MILAERMGWTLDYIDSLDDVDFQRTLEILEAKDKAMQIIAMRKQR